MSQKELEALNQMEQEWTEKMQEEEDKEEEIIRLRDTVTDMLVNNSKIRISAFGKVFELAMVINMNATPVVAKLVVVDKARYEIAGNAYTPMQLDAVFEPTYTLKGNLIGVVEAWLRHITGTVKPEMMEETKEELTVVKEK